MNTRPLLLLLLAVLLPGCSGMAGSSAQINWYRIPQGALLSLHQPLPISPTETRVFVQYGEAMEQGDRNRFDANCSFEVRERKPEAQTIEADGFAIVRTEVGYDQVVQGFHIQWASVLHKGSVTISRYIRFNLSSPDQPNVMRLTCYGGEDDYHQASLPTRSEIEAALGSVATLHW